MVALDNFQPLVTNSLCDKQVLKDSHDPSQHIFRVIFFSFLELAWTIYVVSSAQKPIYSTKFTNLFVDLVLNTINRA